MEWLAMHEDKALIIGQIVLLVTTLGGFFFQLYRESRNRKWDLEDRKSARITMENATLEVKQKIKENTEISTKAFEEANHVNLKILDLKKDTVNIHQRIEDLIKVFDVAGKPEVKVEAKMDAKSVVINTESVTVDKKLKDA